jgi:hypothetical protein
MASRKHIDDILHQWPYDPHAVKVRVCQGADNREVLQMRLDMGLLQLETEGRPDGSRPHGYESYLDYLISRTVVERDEFRLSEEQCGEADREFVQFYHRRVCWLKLQRYRKAVEDTTHTLALMDFCLQHSSDEQWTLTHEQHRPFVVFHHVQASALAGLEEQGPEAAVHEVNQGLQQLQLVYQRQGRESSFDDDELVQRLIELRESLRREYGVGRTLHERLADAVAAEQYELAARIRDELARRSDP